MNFYYKTAYHRSTLIDCLKTEENIDFKTAEKLISCGIYNFYCYDERIEAHRFLIVNMENNIGLPSWLHKYKIKE